MTRYPQDLLQRTIFCFSGVAQNELQTLTSELLRFGAHVQTQLTDHCTYLVTASTNSTKYKEALNRDINIVTPAFVREILKLVSEGQPVDLAALCVRYRPEPFRGCIICVSGLEQEDKDSIEKLTISYGGKYSRKLYKAVTHLIAAAPYGEKYEFAKKWDIVVVTTDWFRQCIIRGGCVNETEFLLKADNTATKPLGSALSLMVEETTMPTILQSLPSSVSSSRATTEPSQRISWLSEPRSVSEKNGDGLYLGGCVVFVSSGICSESLIADIRAILLDGGAVRQRDLSNTVTHAIVASTSLPKAELTLLACLSSPPVLVLPEWLRECYISRKFVSVEKFIAHAKPSESQQQQPQPRAEASKNAKPDPLGATEVRVAPKRVAAPETTSLPSSNGTTAAVPIREPLRPPLTDIAELYGGSNSRPQKLLPATTTIAEADKTSTAATTSTFTQTMPPSITTNAPKSSVPSITTTAMDLNHERQQIDTINPPKTANNLSSTIASAEIKLEMKTVPTSERTPSPAKPDFVATVHSQQYSIGSESETTFPLSSDRSDKAKGPPPKIFAGLVFAASPRLSLLTANRFREMVLSMGGSWQSQFNSKTCTHLLHKGNKKVETFQVFKDAQKARIPIVSPCWVEACYAQGKRLSERLYPHNYNPLKAINIVAMDTQTSPELDLSHRQPLSFSQPATSSPIMTRGSMDEDQFHSQQHTRHSMVISPSSAATISTSSQYNKEEHVPLGVPRNLVVSEDFNSNNANNNEGPVDLMDSTTANGGNAPESIHNPLAAIVDRVISSYSTAQRQRRQVPKIRRATDEPPAAAGNVSQGAVAARLASDAFANDGQDTSMKRAKEEDAVLTVTYVDATATLHRNRLLGSSGSSESVHISQEELKQRKFQLSLLEVAQKTELTKLINLLGGHTLSAQNFDEECTHLIIGSCGRGEKLVAACAAGKWVLRPEYITDSHANGSFLPEDEYEWAVSARGSDSEEQRALASACRMWRIRLSSVPPSRRGSFDGWRVLLFIDVDDPARIGGFSRILQSGRADTTTVRPTDDLSGINFNGFTHIFVLSKKQFPVLLLPFVTQVPCLYTDYIFEYLVNNDADINRFRIPSSMVSESASVSSKHRRQ